MKINATPDANARTLAVRPRPRATLLTPSSKGLTGAYAQTASGICPVIAAPCRGWPRILARLAAWPLVSGQSGPGGSGSSDDVKKFVPGDLSWRDKAFSVWASLDAEGGHVTIQGPSPALSPATTLASSACATWPPSIAPVTVGSFGRRRAGRVDERVSSALRVPDQPGKSTMPPGGTARARRAGLPRPEPGAGSAGPAVPRSGAALIEKYLMEKYLMVIRQRV